MRLFVRFLAAALVIFGGVFAYVMFDVHRFSLQPGGAKADAAIVLGAAVWGEEPSPVFAHESIMACSFCETAR